MINTLRAKFSIIYMGLVFVIAILGIVALFNLFSLGKKVDTLMTDNYKSINAATNMLEAIEIQDSATLIYINIDRKRGIDLFSENYAVFMEWYNIASNNITEIGERDLINKVGEVYKQYNKGFSYLQEAQNEDLSDAIYYNKDIAPIFNELKSELKSLISLNEKAMFRGKQLTTQQANYSMLLILIFSLFAVFGGYFISRHFAITFLKPLAKLSESIKNVSRGKINQHIDIITNDETGMLAREFNEMTKRLQEYENSNLGKLMTERNKSVAIVKSISDPLFVLDDDYKIILVNDACEGFFEIEEDKVLGKHFLEVIRNGEIFDHIISTISSNEEHKEKIIRIGKDADFYFNVVVAPVRDLEKKNSVLIIAMQNVTDLKEVERVKTDFIATISHEFKTPLTSILMATSMLIEGGVGSLNCEQEEMLETIIEDGEKLTTLVDDLLVLTKIETGNAAYNFSVSSINAIAISCIKNFTSQATKKEISIIDELSDNLPSVFADFEKISWVVNNLISNALKYTNAGDTIYIRTSRDKEFVKVIVEDTGAGIPSIFIDRIFEKFVQVKSRDIEARGTGLGLYVAKEIVDKHKGKIWVESSLDEGSKFTFVIPIFKEGL